MLAIIGGTGLTQLANLDVSRRQVVRTAYEEPSGPLTFGAIRGVPVVFLPRHGFGHTIAPHRVNCRANPRALKQQDAGDIVRMTGMPEATLAREIELAYAAIAVVVNHAAGRGASVRGVPLQGIEEVLKDAVGRVRKIIEAFVAA